jgi:hypothetical protein
MGRWIGALACVVLLAGSLSACTPPQPAPPRETKERRDDEALKRQLATPLASAKAGDMARADREFQAILAEVKTQHGANSLQAADIVSAFGVELYNLERKTEAKAYLKRAIAAYRAATGPDNPEVAVSEHDYANIELDLDPDAVSPELVEAVRDALRIRRKSLGEANAETAVTYVLLGRITGDPKLTQGDDARIKAAADLIRTGAAELAKIETAKPGDRASASYRLAELYAHNGRSAETLAAAADYWKAADDQNPVEAMTRKGQIRKLADALAAHGQTAAAATLRKTYVEAVGF